MVICAVGGAFTARKKASDHCLRRNAPRASPVLPQPDSCQPTSVPGAAKSHSPFCKARGVSRRGQASFCAHHMPAHATPAEAGCLPAWRADPLIRPHCHAARLTTRSAVGPVQPTTTMDLG